MFSAPLVSVLLPTYNNELYLSNAIKSILNQTFGDFEFIIIDDCSIDSTQNIINQFNDKRIINVKNDENLGLIKSLNKGLSLAKGKYIARMDGDDYCFPKRLEIEVNFMEKNSDIVIVGGSHLQGDIDTPFLKKQYFPTSFFDIKAYSLFNCPLSHITVMFRKSVITDHNLQYDEKYKYAEDYALWNKLSEFGRVKNLPYFFAKYRQNVNGQTYKANNNQNDRFEILSKIQSMSFQKLGYKLNEKEKKIVYDISETQRLEMLKIEDGLIDELLIFFRNVRKSNVSTQYTSDLALCNIFGVIFLKLLFYKNKQISLNNMFKMITTKYFFSGLFFLFNQRISIKNLK